MHNNHRQCTTQRFIWTTVVMRSLAQQARHGRGTFPWPLWPTWAIQVRIMALVLQMFSARLATRLRPDTSHRAAGPARPATII